MQRFAIIKIGIVDNVIVADQAFVDSHVNADAKILLASKDVVGPGDSYDGSKFTQIISNPAPSDIQSQILSLSAKIDSLNQSVVAIDTKVGITPTPVQTASLS